jgi:hypothetical protein
MPKKMSPAVKRYTSSVLVLMAAYVAMLIMANWLVGSGRVNGIGLWIAAMLPALPVIGVFLAIGRLLATLEDEYVRMLMVRQAMIATGFAMAVCTVWGFLGDFGLVAKPALYWAAVLWFMGLGVGGLTNWYLERDGVGQ